MAGGSRSWLLQRRVAKAKVWIWFGERAESQHRAHVLGVYVVASRLVLSVMKQVLILIEDIRSLSEGLKKLVGD